MKDQGKYVVEAVENYTTVRFTNLKKAKKYARGITDSTNRCTKVWLDGGGNYGVILAAWIYTPAMGGKTFRSQI